MSDWRPLTALPDLRRVGVIALDTETKDDRLRAEMGAGWPFHAGHICGVSVAYYEGADIRSHYFPLRHPDSTNFDQAQLYQWLRDLIASDVRIVTQNGGYDFGWLRAEADIKMPPAERLEEIGALATMVDENRFKYSLDALCAWRGLPGKDETLLIQGIEALGLITNKRKKVAPQTHLWQLPAHYVGPYAEADAVNTLRLYEDLDPILDREGTRAAYRLECDILPMVQAMRWRGIRIDLDAAARARDLLIGKRDVAIAEISDKLGSAISMHEIQSPKWLAQTCDNQNIEYPRTETGRPSFTAGKTGWLLKDAHWLPPLIGTAAKYDKAATDFAQKLIDHTVNGRIHAEIHPHRSEDNGTKSFRFSYSDPPLQQMPSRDEEITPLIRGCFLPEDGEIWVKPDCSQQEFRLVVHYANQHKLPKAADAVARYRDDPDADFHALAATLTGLARTDAKAVNFAKIYGAGVKKFAEMIGRPLQEAQRIYAQYDRELPFLLRLSDIYRQRACNQGYIALYDGALRHFDRFAPGGKWKKKAGPCSLEEAQQRIKDPDHPWHGRGRLYRADTHTALNALIQGSAARHTKLWMRACWREGITPLLQMHDCLDCSVSSREQAELIAQLGCDAVQLDVPMRVDLKFGRNWGDAKHSWEELQIQPAPSTTIKAAVCQATLDDLNEINTGLRREGIEPINTNWRSVPSKAQDPTPPTQPSVNGASQATHKILCPFHDDHTPSLQLYADGHFHCFVCQAHGDVDELPETETAPATSPPAVSSTRKLERSLQLWQAASPITGTLAERYLVEIRKLDLAAISSLDTVLRFHPRCPFNGTEHPCVLALFRDAVTDDAAGIHRTALTAAAEKISRMMLGSWPNPRAIKLEPLGARLIIGEGVETTIAGGALTPRGSALWALGSANAIAKLPLIPGVTELIILVDRDPGDIGMNAARICATRWRHANYKTTLRVPHQIGADFNDLIKESVS